MLLPRLLDKKLKQILDRKKSVLLLGPRQTGKTTLITQYRADMDVSLLIPKIRRQYETDPDRLNREIELLAQKTPHRPLVIIDEVQKVPILLDAVQYLIDQKKHNLS